MARLGLIFPVACERTVRKRLANGAILNGDQDLRAYRTTFGVRTAGIQAAIAYDKKYREAHGGARCLFNNLVNETDFSVLFKKYSKGMITGGVEYGKFQQPWHTNLPPDFPSTTEAVESLLIEAEDKYDAICAARNVTEGCALYDDFTKRALPFLPHIEFLRELTDDHVTKITNKDKARKSKRKTPANNSVAAGSSSEPHDALDLAALDNDEEEEYDEDDDDVIMVDAVAESGALESTSSATIGMAVSQVVGDLVIPAVGVTVQERVTAACTGSRLTFPQIKSISAFTARSVHYKGLMSHVSMAARRDGEEHPLVLAGEDWKEVLGKRFEWYRDMYLAPIQEASRLQVFMLASADRQFQVCIAATLVPKGLPIDATASMLAQIKFKCKEHDLTVVSNGFNGASAGLIHANYTSEAVLERLKKGEPPLRVSPSNVTLPKDKAAIITAITDGPDALGVMDPTTPCATVDLSWEIMRRMKLAPTRKVFSDPDMICFMVLAGPNLASAKLAMLHPLAEVPVPANAIDPATEFGKRTFEYEAAIEEALRAGGYLQQALTDCAMVKKRVLAQALAALKVPGNGKTKMENGVPATLKTLVPVRESLIELLANGIMDIVARNGAETWKGGYWGHSSGPNARDFIPIVDYSHALKRSVTQVHESKCSDKKTTKRAQAPVPVILAEARRTADPSVLAQLDVESSPLRRLGIANPGGPFHVRWEKRNKQNEREAMRMLDPDVIAALHEYAALVGPAAVGEYERAATAITSLYDVHDDPDLTLKQMRELLVPVREWLFKSLAERMFSVAYKKRRNDLSNGLNFETGIALMMLVLAVEFLVKLAHDEVDENKPLWCFFSLIKAIGSRDGRGLKLSTATNIVRMMAKYNKLERQNLLTIEELGFMTTGQNGSNDEDNVHELSVAGYDKDRPTWRGPVKTKGGAPIRPNFFVAERSLNEIIRRATMAMRPNGPGAKSSTAKRKASAEPMELGIDAGRQREEHGNKRQCKNKPKSVGPQAELDLAKDGIIVLAQLQSIHHYGPYKE
ncbi:hypothetical protein H9P43_006943 [Blastocladiella emersonii ATCC 22665]|nr:hypothetical protein H9P43_006943 [Blastocladiella emersonii ATCC 22665]